MKTARIVYAARHGETDWNALGRWQGHTDVPLNDVGRAQARALGVSMRDVRIAGVVSSDLSRARETAEIVASIVGAPLAGIDEALRERRFGVFEGLTRDECAERHADAFQRWTEDVRNVPPGAESHVEVAARVSAAVLRAARDVEPREDAVLVVSHGGAIRALLSAVTKAAFGPIPNAAVYQLDLEEGRFLRASRRGG